MDAASLVEIIAELRLGLARGERVLRLRVTDPDLGTGRFAGEVGAAGVHRPWRTWLELSERLGCRLRTPRSLGDGTLEIEFECLDPKVGWQVDTADEGPEKYGVESGWSRTSKLEDPRVILDFDQALQRIDPRPDARILALGVNSGDEFELIRSLRPDLAAASFIGIDHSTSALAEARARFPAPNFQFVAADLANLADLELGRFDLVLAFATLQSPAIDDRVLLRHIVQERLEARGSVVLAIPNCRYIDGERLYGARMRNLAEPDLATRGSARWPTRMD